MADRLAQKKAQRAELMDHFGWLPHQIARLTPRQIRDYALHARNKDTGAIERPRPTQAEPLSEDARIARVVAEGRALGISEEKIRAAVAQIREHYRKRREEAERGG